MKHMNQIQAALLEAGYPELLNDLLADPDAPENRSAYSEIRWCLIQAGLSPEEATRLAKKHDTGYNPAKADDMQYYSDRHIDARDLRPRHEEE